MAERSDLFVLCGRYGNDGSPNAGSSGETLRMRQAVLLESVLEPLLTARKVT